MATPPDSPIEEEVILFELETTARTPKPIPVALEDLCRLTKFTRQEIRVMYRGFKTVCDNQTNSSNYGHYRYIGTDDTLNFSVCLCRNVRKVSCTRTVSKISTRNFSHTEVSFLDSISDFFSVHH